jgi:hypothetical protein
MRCGSGRIWSLYLVYCEAGFAEGIFDFQVPAASRGITPGI